jgi:hypothetical protein
VILFLNLIATQLFRRNLIVRGLTVARKSNGVRMMSAQYLRERFALSLMHNLRDEL